MGFQTVNSATNLLAVFSCKKPLQILVWFAQRLCKYLWHWEMYSIFFILRGVGKFFENLQDIGELFAIALGIRIVHRMGSAKKTPKRTPSKKKMYIISQKMYKKMYRIGEPMDYRKCANCVSLPQFFHTFPARFPTLPRECRRQNISQPASILLWTRRTFLRLPFSDS